MTQVIINHDVRECEHAAELYRFLAHLFLHEPTASDLAALMDGQRGRLLQRMGYDLLGDAAHQSPEEQLEQIAIEYCRLFILPGAPISLHEAVARGEGRHWGEATVRVMASYRDAGYALRADVQDMPDHIGVELEFVSALLDTEAEALRRFDECDADQVRKTRHEFLTQHVNDWLPAVLDQIRECSQLAFYRELAGLTRDWIRSDLAKFEQCVMGG